MKRLTILAVIAALSLFSFMGSSGAVTNTLGPSDYKFSGYDLTQASTWSSGHCSDPCHIPFVSATSHFGATMNTGTDLKHYWNPDTTYQDVVKPALFTSAGQAVGVICWTSNPQWGITDKIDARIAIGGSSGLNPNIPAGSYLWIGYVPDTYVNLTYAQRINYVPACGNATTTGTMKTNKTSLTTEATLGRREENVQAAT